MRSARGLAVAALVLVLVGCAAAITPPMVENTRQTAAGISVEPQVAWTRLPTGVTPNAPRDGEVWTVDGPLLDQLRFYGGIAPGQTLGTAAQGQILPAYRAGMTSAELAELLTDTITARGSSRVELLSLEPASFGAADGFRMTYRFANADGLELMGMAKGAVSGGRLHFIVFEAAADHYFGRLRPAVERLMESATIAA
jgi:hypothetical protein